MAGRKLHHRALRLPPGRARHGPGNAAREALLLADIDPAASRDKSLGDHNHRLRDRRESLYEVWSPPISLEDEPTPTLRIEVE